MTQTTQGPRALVDEGLFTPINGFEQWITFRGSDVANPAILVVGGPGTGLVVTAPLFAAWEERFTVVQWDQPGGGATLAKHGLDMGALTLERLVRDAIAVAEFACARLNQRKIVLLGISGGSIVGLMAVHRRPALFAAYVGTGQFVHWGRQDSTSYRLVLTRARRESNASALHELETVGPPPYDGTPTDRIKSKYAAALTLSEAAVFTPDVMRQLAAPPASSHYVAPGLKLTDPFAVALAAYAVVRPELMDFDAWKIGLAFQMPLFFFQGDQDMYSTTTEVEAYVAAITAPQKLLALVSGGGHSAVYLPEFLALLTRHVRPVAQASIRKI